MVDLVWVEALLHLAQLNRQQISGILVLSLNPCLWHDGLCCLCVSPTLKVARSFCFWQSLLTCLTCLLNHCGSQALLMVGSDHARV